MATQENIDYFMQKKQDEFNQFKASATLIIRRDGKYLTDGKEMRCIERSSGVIVGKNFVESADRSCPF